MLWPFDATLTLVRQEHRQAVLEQAMMDVMYDTPSHDQVTEVLVTAEMILQGVESTDDDEFLRKRA